MELDGAFMTALTAPLLTTLTECASITLSTARAPAGMPSQTVLTRSAGQTLTTIVAPTCALQRPGTPTETTLPRPAQPDALMTVGLTLKLAPGYAWLSVLESTMEMESTPPFMTPMVITTLRDAKGPANNQTHMRTGKPTCAQLGALAMTHQLSPPTIIFSLVAV